MRGIEAATWGIAVKDDEVRESKAGNAFGIANLAVNEGKTDDNGKEVSTYLKVLLFGALASEASKVAKGDKCYTEGTLSVSIYQHETGPRLDLSIRAFKFEKTGIGKNRPRRTEVDRNSDAPRLTDGVPSFAGTVYSREKPRIQGLNDDRDYRRDELPL
jgi:single-stranded DNA-binding protein